MALHDHQSLELPGDQFLRGLTGLMAPRQLSDAQMPIDAEAGSRMLRKLSTSLRASQLSPDAMQEAGKLIVKNGFKSVYQRSSCRSSEKKAADVLTSRSLVSRSLEGLGRAFRVFPPPGWAALPGGLRTLLPGGAFAFRLVLITLVPTSAVSAAGGDDLYNSFLGEDTPRRSWAPRPRQLGRMRLPEPSFRAGHMPAAIL